MGAAVLETNPGQLEIQDIPIDNPGANEVLVRVAAAGLFVAYRGRNMGSNRFRVDMPRYVDLFMQGRLKLDELVSARIKLDAVNDGFTAMKRRDIGRSVIVF